MTTSLGHVHLVPDPKFGSLRKLTQIDLLFTLHLHHLSMLPLDSL